MMTRSLPSKFRPKMFETLESKCRNETRLGKLANVSIYLLFKVLVPLKRTRVFIQEQRQRFEKIFLHDSLSKTDELGGPAWTKPLTAVSQGLSGTSVLIIAEMSIVQCRKYRVTQKIEAFKRLGIDCRAVSFTSIDDCLREIPLNSMVIFYRTPYLPAVQTYLKECKRLDVRTLYDIDDLVFDIPEYEKHPVFQNMKRKEKKSFLKGSELYQKCLSACDHAIASTPVLAEYMRKYTGGEVFLVENGLDEFTLRIGERSLLAPKKSKKIVIGYGSGTKSHDDDFALVVPALGRILAKYDHVTIALHGYLNIPSELGEFANQIQKVQFLEPEDYHSAVGSFSINLAPLQSSPFNDAKSNIKFLEAAICGVPTVSSKTSTYTQVISNGESGFLADSDEEWFNALEKLILNPDLLQEMGKNARELALAKYHPKNTSKTLKEIHSKLNPTKAKNQNVKPTIMSVNTLYSPHSFGGATKVVEHLNELLQDDWRTIVLTSNLESHQPDLAAFRYEDKGTAVYSLKTKADFFESWGYCSPKMADVFDRVLENTRPDIVHFHSIQGLAADFILKCSLRKIPVVVTMHDAWWICARQFMMMKDKKGCFQKEIDLRVCSDCTGKSAQTFKRARELFDMIGATDIVLAPSEFHRNLIQTNLPSNINVKLNKNGVSLPHQPASPRKLRSDKVLRFAYLGGGNAVHKGYNFLKAAFAKLQTKNYELSLVDSHMVLGSSQISLKEWNVLGKVRSTLPFDANTIDNFYESVDVLLFPSQVHESFGLAVREALVRNTWVVSTNSGGVSGEIIENENGNMIEMSDLDGFVKILETLTNEPLRLEGYENPFASSIRSYSDQATELSELYSTLLCD
jgi:O-antigen biosynthesis protein